MLKTLLRLNGIFLDYIEKDDSNNALNNGASSELVEERLVALKSHFDEEKESGHLEEDLEEYYQTKKMWMMKNDDGVRYTPFTNIVKEGLNIFIEAGSVVNSTASLMTFGFIDYPSFVHYHVYGITTRRCYWDEKIESCIRLKRSIPKKPNPCTCIFCSKCQVCSEAIHKPLIYYKRLDDGRKVISCPYCTTCQWCDEKPMYLQPQGLQRKSSFYVTRRISCITCKPICKEHKLYVDC